MRRDVPTMTPRDAILTSYKINAITKESAIDMLVRLCRLSQSEAKRLVDVRAPVYGGTSHQKKEA